MGHGFYFQAMWLALPGTFSLFIKTTSAVNADCTPLE
jgi:hypothetical protein